MSKNNVLLTSKVQRSDSWITVSPIIIRSDKKIVKGWPPSRRAAQAQRICAQKPWLKTTGPKTSEGKARSCMNARKHGAYDVAWKDLSAALRVNRKFLKKLHVLLRIVQRWIKSGWIFDYLSTPNVLTLDKFNRVGYRDRDRDRDKIIVTNCRTSQVCDRGRIPKGCDIVLEYRGQIAG